MLDLGSIFDGGGGGGILVLNLWKSNMNLSSLILTISSLERLFHLDNDLNFKFWNIIKSGWSKWVKGTYWICKWDNLQRFTTNKFEWGLDRIYGFNDNCHLNSVITLTVNLCELQKGIQQFLYEKHLDMRPITSCVEKYVGWIASSGINCRELEAFQTHCKI